jgi:hypothetical protein
LVFPVHCVAVIFLAPFLVVCFFLLEDKLRVLFLCEVFLIVGLQTLHAKKPNPLAFLIGVSFLEYFKNLQFYL